MCLGERASSMEPLLVLEDDSLTDAATASMGPATPAATKACRTAASNPGRLHGKRCCQKTRGDGDTDNGIHGQWI